MNIKRTRTGAAIVPVIHLNGNSRQSLLDELQEAQRAVDHAFQTLQNMEMPNGRNFYPYGEDGVREAQANHERRLFYLLGIATELKELSFAIREGGE